MIVCVDCLGWHWINFFLAHRSLLVDNELKALNNTIKSLKEEVKNAKEETKKARKELSGVEQNHSFLAMDVGLLKSEIQQKESDLARQESENCMPLFLATCFRASFLASLRKQLQQQSAEQGTSKESEEKVFWMISLADCFAPLFFGSQNRSSSWKKTCEKPDKSFPKRSPWLIWLRRKLNSGLRIPHLVASFVFSLTRVPKKGDKKGDKKDAKGKPGMIYWIFFPFVLWLIFSA